ncbi:MAG TPA: acyl-CoA dehydrogenase family protein [Jatrophihabitans sp.]|nr:acyl-CoA dehydrogenase family protein [Jatrophihabitans sp.]
MTAISPRPHADQLEPAADQQSAKSLFELVAGAVAPDDHARTVWQTLGRVGAISAVLSEPGRPPQLNRRVLAELLDVLDSQLPPGPVLSICVQLATVLPLLRNCAAVSPLADRVLAGMLRGEVVVALAATDGGRSGSDLIELRTCVQRTEHGITVEGNKEWITNAGHCDYLLVLARNRPERHFTSQCWVLIPAAQDGVSAEPAGNGLLPGSGLGHLSLRNVQLESGHIVGRRGYALAELAIQLGTERLAGAFWAHAVCRRVLIDTHRYLQSRPAGDGTLWDNAAVRERFACALVAYRELDAMCRFGMAAPLTPAFGMALKASFAGVTDRVLSECIALHGADSLRPDGLTRLREQFAMFGIAGGATGTMLAGVAEHAEELLQPML